MIIVGLIGIGYWLSLANYDFLVTIVTLSGAGALQLWPGVMGNLFPSRFKFTRAGVMAGMMAGLFTLYWTLIAYPHPAHAAWRCLGNRGQLRGRDHGVDLHTASLERDARTHPRNAGESVVRLELNSVHITNRCRCAL